MKNRAGLEPASGGEPNKRASLSGDTSGSERSRLGEPLYLAIRRISHQPSATSVDFIDFANDSLSRVLDVLLVRLRAPAFVNHLRHQQTQPSRDEVY